MNTISFANNDDIETIQINNYIASNSTYNPVTNENEIIISNPNNRSGTVAISLSVVNALLPLAVKAGFEFANSDSMDEFIYRFLSLDTATEIVSDISQQVGKAKDGVVNFSSSLIQSISSIFNKINTEKSIKYMEISGTRLPVFKVGKYPSMDVRKSMFTSIQNPLKIYTEYPTIKTFPSINNYISSLETWNNLFMEEMDPDKRQRLIDTINEDRKDEPEWKFYKNRLNNL